MRNFGRSCISKCAICMNGYSTSASRAYRSIVTLRPTQCLKFCPRTGLTHLTNCLNPQHTEDFPSIDRVLAKHSQSENVCVGIERAFLCIGGLHFAGPQIENITQLLGQRYSAVGSLSRWYFVHDILRQKIVLYCCVSFMNPLARTKSSGLGFATRRGESNSPWLELDSTRLDSKVRIDIGTVLGLYLKDIKVMKGSLGFGSRSIMCDNALIWMVRKYQTINPWQICLQSLWIPETMWKFRAFAYASANVLYACHGTVTLKSEDKV